MPNRSTITLELDIPNREIADPTDAPISWRAQLGRSQPIENGTANTGDLCEALTQALRAIKWLPHWLQVEIASDED